MVLPANDSSFFSLFSAIESFTWQWHVFPCKFEPLKGFPEIENMGSLADDYLKRALVRIEILPVFVAKGAHADAVRECQEAVEFLLKGVLRKVGIDPPRWHDVSKALGEYSSLFGPELQSEMARISKLSLELRKEREISFYGDEDFLPSESYTRKQAEA
jgi:HEPN domain-containing protein